MPDKYHLTTEFYDFTTGSQMTQTRKRSPINLHENQELGWEEYVEDISVSKPKGVINVRWWEYRPKKLGNKKTPLVILMYLQHSNCWQEIADREGLTLLSFEYIRNARRNANKRRVGGASRLEVEGFHKVVKNFLKKYPIDKSRIYLNALSYGEICATHYATVYGKELAAMALINGPSLDESLRIIGVSEMPAVPCMQIRCDGDITYDGYPEGTVFSQIDKAKYEAFVAARTKQVLANRSVWFNANGAVPSNPVIISDERAFSLLYQGNKCDYFYTEIHDRCHFCPVDVPEFIWDTVFTRYKRKGDGSIELISGKPFTGDNAAAIRVGSRKLLINGKKRNLDAPVLMLTPPEKMMNGSYFGHYNDDKYESIYVSSDILKKAAKVDYSIVFRNKTLTTAAFGKRDPRIEIKDAKVIFDYEGKHYEFLTNCTKAIIDGIVHDLRRPPLFIDGILYIPAKESAEILGLHVSELREVMYISKHKTEIGISTAQILKSEILRG